MDSRQLRTFLDLSPSTRRWRVPIVMLDEIPITKPRPSFLIVNTDTSLGGGIHWIVLHLPRNGPDELFDSLARPPSFYGLDMYLQGPPWMVSHPLQSKVSVWCGAYCLYFIARRASGQTADSIVKDFHRSRLRNNDKLVLDFISQYDI